MSRMMQDVLAVATLLLVTACSQIDPLAEKFQQLSLGDSHTRVLELMGPPTAINSVEIPWVKAEHLAWRTTRLGHVYMVFTIMNHVAAKAIID